MHIYKNDELEYEISVYCKLCDKLDIDLLLLQTHSLGLIFVHLFFMRSTSRPQTALLHKDQST